MRSLNPLTKNENLTGQSLFAINNSAWDSAPLRNHLTGTLTNNMAFDDQWMHHGTIAWQSGTHFTGD
jgi:hypothetical protein